MPDNATCLNRKNGEPLRTYYSEREAEDAAAYVKQKYGAEQTPYPCEKCGQWHLSPKNRQTPSTICPCCLGSGGTFKALYKTIDAAKTRAKIIESERGVKLEAYKCPAQDGYHLTNKKDGRTGDRRKGRGGKRG